MRRASRSQAGVMLIEALVGILIFSVGILALIGMQGAAMRNTTDAKYRSEAAFLATEIIGRMWVDIPNLASYDSDFGTFAPRDTWETRVARTLPGVDLAGATRPRIEHVVIGTAPNASNEVTVTVYWKQPGDTSPDPRKVSMANRIDGGV